ncbi:MAG: hypothetical protein GF355_11970, partial [Candidatus Eisenbacteria bacterium]|nr:hypothetical protein [Candidatus Eisenbacteria bacterium]
MSQTDRPARIDLGEPGVDLESAAAGPKPVETLRRRGLQPASGAEQLRILGGLDLPGGASPQADFTAELHSADWRELRPAELE